MHEEFIEVNAQAVEHLISKLNQPVIAVGTTSLRTIETLYWLGLQVCQNEYIAANELHIRQTYSYTQSADISVSQSLKSLLEWIRRQPGEKLITKTQLFIVPGYSFKIVRGLITNFHQPNSTLLLLVAALIGPAWKSVYSWALDHDYRFLSYGDGCLFLP
jgi:S-adenosylmethionine:tRNA ribosyltransferase-isomerase